MGSSLLDEQWNGTPEEELESYVSEICYIHRFVTHHFSHGDSADAGVFRLLQQIHVRG